MKIPWKVNSEKRGSGLLTVLTASTLLLLLGLTVAGTSFHHLSLSNRLHHAQIAKNLAEDCMAKGLAQVLAQPTRYQGPNFSGFTPLPTAGSPIDERGVLTFDLAEVPGLNANLKSTRIIRSYNNLSGTSDVNIDGTGVVIPPQSVYLRAVGVDHGVEKMMECVVWVPPFPYSMASGGPINIAGQSKIASVKDLADAGDPTKWLPGSLVTNSAKATDALVMEDDGLVTGDVQASGGATISPTTVIKGERRFNAPPVKIPNLRIEDYDTSAKTGVTTYNSSSPGSNQVDGFAYRDGSLNFNSGVTLNGGIVYVKGDLTINGQISGEGALIATGKLTVNGASQSSSHNKVALLSKQDMTLTGTSSNHVGASGLLYTEGKLQADYADITGSAAAPTQDTGAIQFSNVNMLQNSASTNITLQVGGPPSNLNFSSYAGNATVGTGGGGGGGLPYGAVLRGGQPVMLAYPSSLQASISVPDPATRFYDSATHEYHIPVAMPTRALDQNGQHLPSGTYESRIRPGTDPLDSNSYYQVPASASSITPLGPADIKMTVNGAEYAMTDSAWRTAARNLMIAEANAILPSGQGLTAAEIASQIDGAALNGPFLSDSEIPTLIARDPKAAARTSGEYIKYNIALAASTGPGETITFTLNPGVANGSFINLADRVRILYWREVPQ